MNDKIIGKQQRGGKPEDEKMGEIGLFISNK
jgi:hypothetical protein